MFSDVEISHMVELRGEARRNKDFGAADRIRSELHAQGILLSDEEGHTYWERLHPCQECGEFGRGRFCSALCQAKYKAEGGLLGAGERVSGTAGLLKLYFLWFEPKEPEHQAYPSSKFYLSEEEAQAAKAASNHPQEKILVSFSWLRLEDH